MKVTSRTLTLAPTLTLAFALITASAQQSWTNRYDGLGRTDEAISIGVDGNGNVFVTGRSLGSNYDYATIKYSNDGVPLWTNRYNGTGNNVDEARAIDFDSSGNVFVTGRSTGSGSGNDFVTIKYANDGGALWTNRYNGPGNNSDVASAIAVDGAGNVFVTGTSYGGSSSRDYATIKYANDGVPLWTNRCNGQGNFLDAANAIALDGSGNVFVTGYLMGTTSFGSEDYATIKYASSGVPLWTNLYNGPSNNTDIARSIAVDSNGNVFVTGYSSGIGNDYATIKYSSDGVAMWTNRYHGGSGSDVAVSIVVDSSGFVIVTGHSSGTGSWTEYATIKYSNDGIPLWTNRYRPESLNNDQSWAVTTDTSGLLFVTGGSATLKYSSQGVPLWTNRFPVGSTSDGARAMTLDSSGSVFVTGSSSSLGSGTDYITVKYSAGSVTQNAVLKGPEMIAGNLSFDLIAEPGGQFTIQVSTNFLNWQGFREVTIPSSGRTNVLDTLAPGADQKLYRAKRR